MTRQSVKRPKIRVEHNPAGYVNADNEYRAGEPRLCTNYDFANPRHICQNKVRWLVEKRDRSTVGRSWLCDEHLDDDLFDLWAETLEVAPGSSVGPVGGAAGPGAASSVTNTHTEES